MFALSLVQSRFSPQTQTPAYKHLRELSKTLRELAESVFGGRGSSASASLAGVVLLLLISVCEFALCGPRVEHKLRCPLNDNKA